MDDKKLAEAALMYAMATNKIEDLELSPEELEEVKKVIQDNDNSIMMLISDIMKRLGDKDDKTK